MDDSPRRGDDRVPPGQYVTKKWPVLSVGDTPEVDLAGFELRLFGRVEAGHAFDWQALQSLPRREVTADFHCVTRFSTLDNRWSGFATRDVLGAVTLNPGASHAMIHCYGGYTTNLPLDDLLSEHALLADRHGGEPLAPDHGGPLRLVVPHLYAWKSAKWISGIELLNADERGFWERNGYHTYGDPWAEQRFSSQETRQAWQVRRSVGL
ncbi:MAG: sulfite oxidase-like oxidoreductase [Holophagales bacterium]|nr:sulfite oxidase-like oxidoreductase [Holophagales bacterium]MYG32284.1 sulfite oxidase-like oxidoreductase [Holophagales bacterium]MYI78547.1 sulfite oxidase-like oxidoreductase [Holophagales bacterium]